VGLVLLLAGCAGNQVSASGVVAVVAQDNNGMEALLEGELTATAGDCLGVVTADNTVLLLVVPPGSGWVDDDTIRIGNYGDFSIGDHVAFGGGAGTGEWNERLDVPDGCPLPEDQSFFVNHG
jgi:hypothetical protein